MNIASSDPLATRAGAEYSRGDAPPLPAPLYPTFPGLGAAGTRSYLTGH
jgi:hypothetical protein